MTDFIVDLTVFAGTLALGFGTIIGGWGLTALIIEGWDMRTGKRHDGTAILAVLGFLLIGAAILGTL